MILVLAAVVAVAVLLVRWLGGPGPQQLSPDHGAGISPGKAARVFNPFFTTARDAGATDLRLAIVRSQLAVHGGKVALVPAVRVTRFGLRLPLAPEGDGAGRPPCVTAGVSGSVPAGPRSSRRCPARRRAGADRS